MHQEWRHGHRPWSHWPLGLKALAIAGGAVALAGLFALVAAVVMWLWNWLMPELFRLPHIGFWQAAGILVLSHLLFKGGSGHGRFGRAHWRKARIRDAMRSGESEEGKE